MDNIPDVSGLITGSALDAKARKIKNKTHDYNKYITTPEFNRLAGISFDERLK